MLKARLRHDSDREKDLDQARPDQPFRRDGGATLGGIEPVEIGIKARQRIIDDLADLAQWVTRRDALLNVHIAEKRTCRLVRSPHDHPRKRHRKSESCSSNRVQGRVFQQPAKNLIPRFDGAIRSQDCGGKAQ